MKSASHRPIRYIAADIMHEWEKPYFGAKPYIEAMLFLNTIEDRFIADSAESILEGFLSNASTFRGERARELKAELKAHLGRK
jgi:hypothetical protein